MDPAGRAGALLPPTILGDELDAGGFKGDADGGECPRIRLALTSFKVRKGRVRYLSDSRQILPLQAQHRPCCGGPQSASR
jgi:hypothetical protein